MNKKSFCRIAYRRARHLCILNNTECHWEIRYAIHIDVTDAGTRFNHGYTAVLYNMPDESCTSAWNDNIEQTCQMRHDIDGGTFLHGK